MSYEHSQRRRFAVAVALTAVLVPAAFLLDRGDDEPEATTVVTVVGTVVDPQSGAAARAEEQLPPTTPPETDIMGTSPVDLLHDQLPESSNDPATIAIPRLPHSISGPATFSRNISQATDCMVTVPEVPFGSRVTVTNLDNNRSVDCINRVGGTRPDEAVVLHADAFLQIGDLTDAPVPVQVTW
jgi:hypothetical protein